MLTGESPAVEWQERVARFTDRHFGKLAVSPVLILLLTTALIPFVIMLWISFTDFSFNLPNHDGRWIGLNNYARALFHDERFRASLRIQGVFLVSTVPLECALGLLVAITIRASRSAGRIILPVLVVPMLLAPITVGMIWRLLLHGDYGLLGYYLGRLSFPGSGSILGTPTTAFAAVVLIDIWQWTPFFVIILLAGLYSMPEAPFQAARVDGASNGRIFRTLTLPLLRPAITVGVLIRAMDSFKEFDKISVLTRGGPASATELVSVYAWIVSFDHGELAYGSALTILVYLLIYFASTGLFWVGRKDWR